MADLRQGEPSGKSYRDQRYSKGYWPNLATDPPGQESLWASPACSCSATSQGSAAAATSSASPSVMVLTMMVPVLPWTWNAEQRGGPLVSTPRPRWFPSRSHSRTRRFGAGGQAGAGMSPPLC
ncbi:uncharacterized protein [Pithys albifrons albifrons]|uniref:uncharacterized protein isoform X2 n=1 Tax=Pithys albifrons albifrons TaxID=3385563 RepID=UPI003A5CF89A